MWSFKKKFLLYFWKLASKLNSCVQSIKILGTITFILTNISDRFKVHWEREEQGRELICYSEGGAYQLKFLLKGHVLALTLLVVPHSSVCTGKCTLFVKLLAGYRE